MGVREVLQSAVQAIAVGGLTTLERVQTGVAFNPIGEGYRDDPYPQYRKLLSRDPVHRSRLGNGWVLTRYADVTQVLTDRRFLNDEPIKARPISAPA